MRLTGLTLRRYGPFADTSLAFDPAPGRINLVLAPNGAGKSVLRHAFGELLFGIGGQTPMGFRHGYPGMKLSATGVSPDGSPFAFTRTKGNRNTLTGPDDAPLDQASLDRLLGRADSRLLSQLFALDTERLRQGGRDLLSSGGALADALLAAAGGLREASALRRTLEDERDKLAPQRRAASRPFYAALDRWTESRKTLRQSLVRPQEWEIRERALHDAADDRDVANRAVAAAGETLRRLERIRRTRPHLHRHAAASAWLAAHPDAPDLPPDLAGRLLKAREATTLAAHATATMRATLARLDAEIAGIPTDDALLARADEVAALGAAIGLVEQARDGLPQTEAALAQVGACIRAGLATLDLPPGTDPASLLPSPSLLAELRRLIADATAQHTAQTGLPRRTADAEANLADAEAALATLPPPADVRRLEELLAAIRQDGDPVAALAAARRAVAVAEARLATALSALPAELRDPSTLAAIDVPDPALLARRYAARDAAEAALARAQETLARTATALDATQRDQAALLAAGAPPTREALAEARAHRDTGWALVFRRLDGETDRDAEAAYAGGQPLALAYADAVNHADRLADARWNEAERAAAAEHMVRTLVDQSRQHAEAATARDIALRRRDEVVPGWDSLVRPFRLGAESGLTEVQRLLAGREAGLAAMEALASLRAALDELQARQDGAATRLAQALGEAPGEDGTPALPPLLDRMEARVRHDRTADSERQAREAALRTARTALRELAAERTEAEARRNRWQADWQAALAWAGAAPDLTTPALEERLLVCEALGTDLRQTASLEAQADTWRLSLRRFHEGYAGLCAALKLDPEPDPVAGVRILDRRQREEGARATRKATLRAERDREAAALQNSETALTGAELELQAVLAAAGAATPQDAEARIALGTERTRQDTLRRAAEDELLAGGDALPLQTLRAEADALPPDAVDAAILEASAARDRHAAEAQDAVATVTRLDLEMHRVANDDGALRAAATEAAAAGEIGRTLEDALLVQVAAGLLETALATVQEGADDRLLRRIGTAFSTLTDGAYTGVASQEDDRGAMRLTLRSRTRPRNDTAKDTPDDTMEDSMEATSEGTTVDALSEGTRDALFLALRLVAIEDQAKAGNVPPFLGDDILQSFDDARAAAALRALLNLSRTTQVILLSHHDHLLPVLQGAVSAEAIHVQRLGG